MARPRAPPSGLGEDGELLAKGKLDERLLTLAAEAGPKRVSRAIAKESRMLTATRLRDPVVRHDAVEARGPYGTLAGRSRRKGARTKF